MLGAEQDPDDLAPKVVTKGAFEHGTRGPMGGHPKYFGAICRCLNVDKCCVRNFWDFQFENIARSIPMSYGHGDGSTFKI